MKVLHLCTYANIGGAGRACYKIHSSLLSMGVDSKILTLITKVGLNEVYGIKANKIKVWAARRFDKALIKFFNFKTSEVFTSGLFGVGKVSRHEIITEADVIALYWVTGGFLDIWAVVKLLNMNKPVVWRLSDMWLLTDGRHYTGGSDSYKKNHRFVDVFEGDNEWNIVSILIWKLKKIILSNADNLTIIAPSRWMAECVRRSTLTSHIRVEIIGTGVDETVFKERNKISSRRLYDLPLEKKIILFGAINAVFDKRKGGDKLLASLNKIPNNYKENIHIVVFGSDDISGLDGFSFSCYTQIDDDIKLSHLYNCADVFVAPSLEENLANTVLESMAVGVPVVAFSIGGMTDVIDHKENGYLAKPFCSTDLSHGICYILNLNGPDYMKFKDKAEKKILEKYTLSRQADSYYNLYNKLLEGS
jgi:glycosyltransferase involved in cell wall biosynthesis